MLQTNERQELMSTLKELQHTCKRLEELWGRLDSEDMEWDILTEDYPLDMSFDDMTWDIDNWVDTCIEKLGKL